MNCNLILGIVALLVIGALWRFFYSTGSTKSNQPTDTTTGEASSATFSAEVSRENTIVYTDSGFGPQTLTVKSGEFINWVNDSSGTVKVGSAVHPNHTVNQEITNDQYFIELALGESAKVQLTKIGEWGYHDHLKPSMTGTITVQ